MSRSWILYRSRGDVLMPKPQWLNDIEQRKHIAPKPTCELCVNFMGRFVGHTKHKSKEKCDIYECLIHPGCYNTKFSIVCNDFDRGSMV